jgi:hypothetical protein
MAQRRWVKLSANQRMDFRKKRVCPTVLFSSSLPHEYDLELSRSVLESAKSQSQDHKKARLSFLNA